jgi:superfamily I DNA/RNA helicase
LVDSHLTLADVKEALERLSVRPRELERPGNVQVTSVARVRGRRFETLIVGGLNADEFPRSPPETMLPGSAVEEVMQSFGGTGSRALGTEYEEYLFYLAVTRAKRRLVLSARSTDDDGDPVRLSPFFEVACDSFRDPDDDELPPHAYRGLLRHRPSTTGWVA